MKPFTRRLLVAACSALLALQTRSVAAADDDDKAEKAAKGAGWEVLFNGKNTSRWRGYKQEKFPEKGWKVEGDALRHVAGEGGGDLITREKFGSFELRFDWKVAPGANSGVIYRVTEDRGASYETGPEYQVLDDTKHADGKNPKTSAGALYALIAPNADKALKPVGEWNKARIVVRGSHVEHWVNKKKVVEYEWGSPEVKQLIAGSKFKGMPGFARNAEGHICFQDHGDDVWFRKIRIRRL